MLKRNHVAALSLSAAALIGIASYEGFRGKAYDDGVGVQTIGFGTTQGVKAGDTITVERALIRLGRDADQHAREMSQCITTPLYQHEYDAYASFAYNVGSSAFCKSTLVKKLNSGDYAGACRELLRWNRAGGRVMPGLTKRRESEYQMCIGAVWTK